MNDSKSVTISITSEEALRAFRVLVALEWEQYEQVKPLVRAIGNQFPLRRQWENSNRGIAAIGETETLQEPA